MTTPSQIAHYRITSKLGEGGMGAVYRATDTKLSRDVAIKILPDTFANDPDRLARFRREAQVLASLNHPNIASIYGVEERAIVMELVEGHALAGPIPVEEALPLIHQLIDALEYAHEKGVIHRDLKPANIQVTPQGQLKVLDFGLAKALSNETSAADPTSSPTLTMRATMAGVIMGTAAYMSPEQARGLAVDKRADIWAFGVIVYELLTGKALFAAPTISDTLAAVLRQEPDFALVPPHFQRLLRLCLTRDPRLRLRDISGARLLLDEPAAATPAQARSRLAWAVAAVLAAIAAPAVWFALHPRTIADRPLIRLNVDLGPDAIVGLRNTVTLSPDGTRMVYCVQGANGVARLAMRALDQAKAQVLSGTEGASDPFFTADGREIAFIVGDKVRKMPVQGGAAVDLWTKANLRGAAWSRDGSLVSGNALGGGLFRLPAGGGAPVPFTKLAGREVTHRWPEYLPGERSLLFVSHFSGTGFDDAEIQAMPLSKAGPAVTVVKGGFAPRYVPSGHLLYVHDSALFGIGFNPGTLKVRGEAAGLLDDVAAAPFSGGGQYDVASNGTLVYLNGKQRDPRWTLVFADAAGKTQPLALDPAQYRAPTVSPDGRSLAWMTANRELWVYDIARETATRVLSESSRVSDVVWTPDSKHLVVSGLPGETAGERISCVRADGTSQPRQIFAHTSNLVPNSFSPDGKWLAIQIISERVNFDIAMLPMDWSDPDSPKAGKPEPFVSTPAVESMASFSPDGKWVAYRSGDGGVSDLFVQAFPGPGGRWQISNGGGSFPQWSHDGRQLFFESPDNRIMVVDVAAQGGSLSLSKPRRWMDRQLLDLTITRNYSVMPDGKHLVIIPKPDQVEEKTTPHVTFLLNFFDELKRRIP